LSCALLFVAGMALGGTLGALGMACFGMAGRDD